MFWEISYVLFVFLCVLFIICINFEFLLFVVFFVFFFLILFEDMCILLGVVDVGCLVVLLCVCGLGFLFIVFWVVVGVVWDFDNFDIFVCVDEILLGFKKYNLNCIII